MTVFFFNRCYVVCLFTKMQPRFWQRCF